MLSSLLGYFNSAETPNIPPAPPLHPTVNEEDVVDVRLAAEVKLDQAKFAALQSALDEQKKENENLELKLQNSIKKINSDAESARAVETELTDRLVLIEKERAEEKRNHQLALEQLQAQIKTLEEQRNDKEKQFNKEKAEKEKLSEESFKTVEQLYQLESELEQQRNQVNELYKSLVMRGLILTSLRTKNSGLMEEKNKLTSTLEKQQAQFDTLNKKLALRAMLIASLRTKNSKLADQLKSNQVLHATLTEELNALSKSEQHSVEKDETNFSAELTALHEQMVRTNTQLATILEEPPTAASETIEMAQPITRRSELRKSDKLSYADVVGNRNRLFHSNHLTRMDNNRPRPLQQPAPRSIGKR